MNKNISSGVALAVIAIAAVVVGMFSVQKLGSDTEINADPVELNIPERKTTDGVTLTPSIKIFVIDVPSSWNVWQGDGGIGSADVFENESGTRTSLSIKFPPNTDLSWLLEDAQREVTVLGGKTVIKAERDGVTHILAERVYSPVKQATYSVYISYDNHDEDAAEIVRAVESIVFEPDEDLLEGAQGIP